MNNSGKTTKSAPYEFAVHFGNTAFPGLFGDALEYRLDEGLRYAGQLLAGITGEAHVGVEPVGLIHDRLFLRALVGWRRQPERLLVLGKPELPAIAKAAGDRHLRHLPRAFFDVGGPGLPEEDIVDPQHEILGRPAVVAYGLLCIPGALENLEGFLEDFRKTFAIRLPPGCRAVDQGVRVVAHLLHGVLSGVAEADDFLQRATVKFDEVHRTYTAALDMPVGIGILPAADQKGSSADYLEGKAELVGPDIGFALLIDRRDEGKGGGPVGAGLVPVVPHRTHNKRFIDGSRVAAKEFRQFQAVFQHV